VRLVGRGALLLQLLLVLLAVLLLLLLLLLVVLLCSGQHAAAMYCRNVAAPSICCSSPQWLQAVNLEREGDNDSIWSKELGTAAKT